MPNNEHYSGIRNKLVINFGYEINIFCYYWKINEQKLYDKNADICINQKVIDAWYALWSGSELPPSTRCRLNWRTPFSDAMTTRQGMTLVLSWDDICIYVIFSTACTNNHLQQKLLPLALRRDRHTHSLSNSCQSRNWNAHQKRRNILCKCVHCIAKYLNLIGSPLSTLFLLCFFPWLLLWLCTGRSGSVRCLGLAGS